MVAEIHEYLLKDHVARNIGKGTHIYYYILHNIQHLGGTR